MQEGSYHLGESRSHSQKNTHTFKFKIISLLGSAVLNYIVHEPPHFSWGVSMPIMPCLIVANNKKNVWRYSGKMAPLSRNVIAEGIVTSLEMRRETKCPYNVYTSSESVYLEPIQHPHHQS